MCFNVKRTFNGVERYLDRLLLGHDLVDHVLGREENEVPEDGGDEQPHGVVSERAEDRLTTKGCCEEAASKTHHHGGNPAGLKKAQHMLQLYLLLVLTYQWVLRRDLFKLVAHICPGGRDAENVVDDVEREAVLLGNLVHDVGQLLHCSTHRGRRRTIAQMLLWRPQLGK
jgi:hypothetical protein